ncbi:MAG: helix-turn-helix domain-containing protein [Candidatus Aminicenantes bacterium]|nr:helix-turn-helix domain-containing protein [Candidatus Aminicenantes bacterium]
MLKNLGVKVRKVRESLRLTQEQISKGTGLSSEFISLIEKGKRYPSLESLEKISNYLNKNISFFLDDEPDPFEKIRKDKDTPKNILSELKTFEKYCRDYLNMEHILKSPLQEAPLYSDTSPEIMAAQERQRLGLGIQPINNIFALLETKGLHILRQSLKKGTHIAGAFVYYRVKQAGFALINTNQSYSKQIITAAHEYCHYLKDREFISILDNPDIFVDDYLPLYPSRERFAHLFSLSFLIPDEQIKLFLNRLNKKSLTIEDIILLKRYLGMPILIVLKTLLKMKVISMSEYQEYKKQEYLDYEKSLFGYIKAEKDPWKRKTKVTPSDRYKTLAVQALKNQEQT